MTRIGIALIIIILLLEDNVHRIKEQIVHSIELNVCSLCTDIAFIYYVNIILSIFLRAFLTFFMFREPRTNFKYKLFPPICYCNLYTMRRFYVHLKPNRFVFLLIILISYKLIIDPTRKVFSPPPPSLKLAPIPTSFFILSAKYLIFRSPYIS